MAFIMLKFIPSMPSLLSVIIIKGCWILSTFFSASIVMIIYILSLFLLMWFIIWLTYVELCLTPRDKSHLTMEYDYLKCCWIYFVSIFWGIFRIGSWRILVYILFRVFACLLYHSNANIIKCVWNYFHFKFLVDFEKDSC